MAFKCALVKDTGANNMAYSWDKRFVNSMVTSEVFEQIKSLVVSEMVLERMIPRVMEITGNTSHYAAYRWITKAAVAVKNDFTLSEINAFYKGLGEKPKGNAGEAKEALAKL